MHDSDAAPVGRGGEIGWGVCYHSPPLSLFVSHSPSCWLHNTMQEMEAKRRELAALKTKTAEMGRRLQVYLWVGGAC